MASTGLLDGRVAFITGSTRGIGWVTARTFAREGATVVLNGRADAEAVRARAEELRAEFGVEAHGITCDVAQPAEIRRAFQEIFRAHKRLDVLVNNAGILRDALLGMIPDELVHETLAINAAGPIFCLQEASRLMSRRRSGSIVNVTSIIGTNGNEGQSVYGASKAAVIGLTRSAAKELAPRNIRVNAVAPGFIATDMTRALPEDKFRQRADSVKMGRVGAPEDVANAILFLASDLSSYVTGQVLGVDGGMLI